LQHENQSTKRRILTEALTLFSERGYESVTVAEIAKAVGVKAPALYKHYKSKQDIFDAILAEMKASYARQAASMQMDGVDANKDEALYLDNSEDGIVKMSIDLFLYFLHDESVRKFRKMLAIEQYNNKDLAATYAERYVDFPMAYQSAVFGLMAGAGAAVPENAHIMALQYYAPVYMYMTLCDCQPEREPEALTVLEQHFRQFIRLYHKEGDPMS
jgi:AcrR family transcriptional regulator